MYIALFSWAYNCFYCFRSSRRWGSNSSKRDADQWSGQAAYPHMAHAVRSYCPVSLLFVS